MFIQDNVPLQAYSTMRLGGTAAYLSEVNTREEIPELVAWAIERQLPIIMIGDGSNIVWKDEGFQGLILVNRIKQFETSQTDDKNLYLTAGAGEDWDSVVAKSVELGWYGIAELSMIPGTTGATPVQNVGAYGREISDCLVTMEVYDLQEKKFVILTASECNFGYRTSRFKTTDRNRFLITSVTLLLTKHQISNQYYEAVQAYFNNLKITNPTPQQIRDAVVAIRTAKLPDPKVVANTGSFFGNPIINYSDFEPIKEAYPHIKYWDLENEQIKISAAWLVEQAGFANNHDPQTGMGTWPNQSLVLINENAKSTADLLAYKQKIVAAVEAKFGIILSQEPELLP